MTADATGAARPGKAPDAWADAHPPKPGNQPCANVEPRGAVGTVAMGRAPGARVIPPRHFPSHTPLSKGHGAWRKGKS